MEFNNNILNKKLEDILNKFKELDLNKEKDVNDFLKYLMKEMKYLISIFKEIENKKSKGGTCIKCNNFKGGVSPADRIIMRQQQSECFICTQPAIRERRNLTDEQFNELGPIIGHEESGRCQNVAHVECWRQFFNSPIRHECPNCRKNLEFQEDEYGVRIVVRHNDNQNNDDFDNWFAAQLNDFIINNRQIDAQLNNREIDNNDMIYKSLLVALFFTHLRAVNMTNNPFIYLILGFSYRYFTKMLDRNYRRNPNPPLGIIALGRMVIPFFVLALAIRSIDAIYILGGPHLFYDTYDNIKNIIEIIYEKLNRDGIENPYFNLLREEILNYDVNNALDIANIYGGNKKSKKKKIKMNKTKKNRYFNSLNPLLETNYLKMLSYKKQKGSGNILPTFRNSRVQPEENYTYRNYNNSTVVPLNSVPFHQYTTFRCNWKYNRFGHDFTNDIDDGNLVDRFLDITINPNEDNDDEWVFAGVTNDAINVEIEEYITYYRRLLIRSFTNDYVNDIYSEQFLSTYDIQKKMYELLAIRHYLRYNPIQQAHAEIVPPAEPAYIANGGKKKTKKR